MVEFGGLRGAKGGRGPQAAGKENGEEMEADMSPVCPGAFLRVTGTETRHPEWVAPPICPHLEQGSSNLQLRLEGWTLRPYGTRIEEAARGPDVTEKDMIPADPVEFVRSRLESGKVYWTYHVNMRLVARAIDRNDVLQAASSLRLVEAYPEDKYLPSYLLLARAVPGPFHLVCAVDVEGDNIRIVTAYRPDLAEWDEDLTSRRTT